MKIKTITFWRLYLLVDGRRKTPENADWGPRLSVAARQSMKERTIDDRLYDPQVDGSSVLLGVHVPLKTDFMSSIDTKTSKVRDLLNEADQSTAADFAHSTAMSFLPVGNVIAVILGGVGSPKASSVLPFLKKFVPPGDGAHWALEPLMDEDQIKVLEEEAEGVIAFSTNFSTSRNLFTPDGSAGVVSYADQIAERLGADVEVSVEVRLAPDGRHRSAMTRFLSVVKGDLPRLVGDKKSKTKAKALLPDGVEEELELVRHRLAADVQVDDRTSESRRFSALLEHLKTVGGEMETKVKRLLEG